MTALAKIVEELAAAIRDADDEHPLDVHQVKIATLRLTEWLHMRDEGLA